MIDADRIAAEVQAIRRVSSIVTAAPRALAKIAQAMPIGPAPTIRTSLTGRDFAASHGVGADGEEFGHRGLVETNAARIDEVVVGDAEPIRHAAVAVHAEHIEPLAAVGLAAPARDAVGRNADRE